MATSEGSAALPIEIPDDDSDQAGSPVDSQHGSFAAEVSRPSICQWRTPNYYDQECSRYFDCPSHQVERAQPEAADAPIQALDQDDAVHADSDVEMESPTSDAHRPSDGAVRPQTPEEHSALAEENMDMAEELVESDAYDASEGGSASDDSDGAASSQSENEGQEPEPVAGSRASHPLQIDTAPAREVVDLTVDSPAPPDASSQRAAQLAHRLSRELPRSPPPPTPPPLSPPAQRQARDQRRATTTRDSRRPSDTALPRWQPDAEVTICPICHTQFSIFVRKHHCRKCGRVVCNSCSPHRITIPYQYIVQPPGAPRPMAQRYSSSFMGNEGSLSDFSTLGGGERVRLCNPCVPDPNVTPHQAQESAAQRSHLRSQSGVGGAYNNDESRRYGAYFGPGPVHDALSRSRSVSMNSSAGSSSARPPTNHYPSTQSRIMAGTPPAYMPYSSASGSQGPSPLYARYRSLLDVGPSSSASSSSTPAFQQRSLPPPPQIAEEDECPVCHRELPPRTLPNFEALREAHINICITSHSSYGSTPTATATAAAGPGQQQQRAQQQQGAGADDGELPPPPPPPRRTGMFPYLATEKDCVDSAECTICLEEFEVGVPMARLECLCRFHRACIRAWFVNHPGRCPVHQHDSFGY